LPPLVGPTISPPSPPKVFYFDSPFFQVDPVINPFQVPHLVFENQQQNPNPPTTPPNPVFLQERGITMCGRKASPITTPKAPPPVRPAGRPPPPTPPQPGPPPRAIRKHREPIKGPRPAGPPPPPRRGWGSHLSPALSPPRPRNLVRLTPRKKHFPPRSRGASARPRKNRTARKNFGKLGSFSLNFCLKVTLYLH